jgi:hypothetical protein
MIIQSSSTSSLSQLITSGFTNFWNWLLNKLVWIYQYITGNLPIVPYTPYLTAKIVIGTINPVTKVLSNNSVLVDWSTSLDQHVTSWTLERNEPGIKPFTDTVNSNLKFERVELFPFGDPKNTNTSYLDTTVISGHTYFYTLIANGLDASSNPTTLNIFVP